MAPILAEAWWAVRGRLGQRSAAMLQMVDREGPLTAESLSKIPLFIGITFSDRLMSELVLPAVPF